MLKGQVNQLPFRYIPEEKLPKFQRIRYTNYSFMMNTNYKPHTAEEAREISEELGKACRYVFENFDSDRLIKWVTDTQGNTIDREATVGDILRMKTTFEVEMGTNYKRGGRMHIHGYIMIAHFRMLKLNYKELRDYFNEVLYKQGSKHPLLSYRFKVEKITPKQYMNKWVKKDVTIEPF